MAKKAVTRKTARKPAKVARKPAKTRAAAKPAARTAAKPAKARTTPKPGAKQAGSRALVAKAKPADKGLAATARRGLATVIKDVEVIGAKVVAEGLSVAKAGRQRAAEAIKVATPVAKRTTRTAAKGVAGAARVVEHAADALADKLK